MSAPVWSLSVDIATKTAVFQSGLGDAARAARSSFAEIKDSAAEMGAATSYSMTEARHSVTMLGEEFGIRLPRALSTFIAGLGPIGGALEAAFPFLAIAAGASLLIEHLTKIKETSDRVSETGARFGKDAADAMGHWDDQILQTDERIAELNGNYLQALKDKLTQIDHATLHELGGQFDKLAAAALADFKNMETSWMAFLFLGKQDWGAKEAEQRIHALSAAMDSAKDVDAQKQVAVTALAAAQTRLNDLDKSYHTSMVSGTAEAIAAYQKLIPQLQSIVDLTNHANEAQNSAKKFQRLESEDQHPEAFHPELFVDAENKKRVSITATIEAIKKEQEAANAAAKLELLGMEGLSKGLKEIADERAKLAQEAGKEGDRHDTKMAELQAAADREAAQLKMAAGRMSGQEYLNMELGFAAQEYEAKKAALQKELAALDQSGKEYENKKRELNNRLLELDKQFQNQKQVLEVQGQKTELATIKQAESRMEQAYAQGFSQVIMGKKSFSQMMAQLDGQILESAMQNMIMAVAQQQWQDDKSKFSSAEKAAAKAFAWAPNPLIGAPLAAAAFAAVMAFEGGGLVPGVELGDVVPARLEPGETVLPKRMTERLNSASDSGSSNRQPVHVHMHNSHTIHALDSQGMDRVLAKHADTLQRHFEHTVRKMNR